MWSKKKEGRITFRKDEFTNFMDEKLNQLAALLTNLTIALAIVSILVVLDYFNVPEIYLFGLILIPLVGRGFVISWYESWLKENFKGILG